MREASVSSGNVCQTALPHDRNGLWKRCRCFQAVKGAAVASAYVRLTDTEPLDRGER